MKGRFFRRKRMSLACIAVLVLCLFSGCKSKDDVIVGKKAPYAPQEKQVSAKKSSNLYLIREMNMAEETITLQAITGDDRVVRYPYSLATKFENRFGDFTSWNSFYPGRVVTIGDRLSDKTLSKVTLTDEVWEQEDVKKYELNMEKGMLTIGKTKYHFNEETPVFSNDVIASAADIGKEDVLRVVGKDKDILSVSITTGHGTIKLMNTELFQNSMVSIGKQMFTEITEEGMEIEMPEGSYPLTVANDGYGGTKDIEVKRGETTVVDLDELKGEGPKSCDITFHVAVEGAKIYLDGAEVPTNEIVKTKYGKHVLMVQAEGYDTWKKTLYVNSPKADISLDLSDENTKKSEQSTGKGENSSSNSSNSAKESTSNSSQNINKSTNSGDNYGGTSQKNSSNVRNADSTDYLQTMQEALQSLLKTD
jgi:hypothetical protein